MRSAMVSLSGFLTRRRWWVVGAWLAVVVAAFPLASRQTEDLTGGGFDVPGSQSQTVEDAVTGRFETSNRRPTAIVLQPAPGTGARQAAAAVDRAAAGVDAAETASLAPAVKRRARAELDAGRVAVVPVDAGGDADQLVDTATQLRDELDPGESVGGVKAYVVGQPAMWAALSELSKDDLQSAEGTGFPIVALILVAVFGSLAAATLPLALGFAAVLITGAVIFLLSQRLEMSVFVTNMASMIGIGVAVDYSLFILARFRESVRAGMSAEAARAQALSTSGLAVTFSGMAVIISLASLWMVQNQALRSMALGAMVVVAIAILVAITLLPTLIRILGHRVEAGGLAWSFIGFLRHPLRRRRRPGSTDPDRETFWERWTERVMRRPVLSVVSVSALLLTLAIPVLSIRTGNGALEQFPADNDARVGTELAARVSGTGADPVRVLATFDRGTLEDPANAAAVRRFTDRVQRDSEVASVAPPVSRGDRALIDVRTKGAAGESQESMDLVERLRDEVVPDSALAGVATVDVGGEPARIRDARAQIN